MIMNPDEVTFYETNLDGVLHLTREAFDAADKEEKVLYVVDESNGFSLYLGEKELLADLKQISTTIKSIESNILAIKRRLGMLEYPFADVNGDGTIGADDVHYLEEFSAKLGAGEYAEYDTIEEKWNAYTEEKGLENSHYISDINGDGEMRADDVAYITAFISETGAGNYPNTAEGFREYMLDNHNAIFGANISGFRLMTREAYNNLPEKRADIVYFIKDGGGISVYVGELQASGGGAPIGVLTELPFEAKVVQTQAAGTMNWIEQVEEG